MSGKVANINEFSQLFKVVADKENLEDYEVVFKNSASKGDGYLGVITFVDLIGNKNGKKKEFHLVVKSAIKEPSARTSINVREAFVVEKYLYTVVLDAYRKFEISNGVKNPFNSTSRCLAACDIEFKEVLILENLKLQGFEMHKKGKRLNTEHLLKIFQEYGKYHALSLAYRNKCPELFDKLADKLKENLVTDMFVTSADVIDTMLAKIVKYLKNKDPSLGTLYEKFCDGICQKIVIYLQQRDEYSVITHGDAWVNNFMFKYEEGQTNDPADVRFLDWQCSLFSSPGFDLGYFFWTSSDPSCYDKHDYFLSEYHTSLNNHLNNFGLSADVLLPMEELKKQWVKYGITYGLVLSSFIFKAQLIDPEEVPDITSTTEEGRNSMEEFLKDFSRSDEYFQNSETLIRYIHSLGFF